MLIVLIFYLLFVFVIQATRLLFPFRAGEKGGSFDTTYAILRPTHVDDPEDLGGLICN